MNRPIAILALLAILCGFVGCAGSADSSKANPEKKDVQAPGVPPDGV